MRKVIMKSLKAICFIGIFCLIFLFFQELLRGKWVVDDRDDTASTSTFMELRSLEDNTVDVLFIGTSHTLYGIDPMYLYENTGITSFAFSGPGLRYDATYLILEDTLKTQSPKVIFLDASGMQYNKQQKEPRVQKVIDQLSLSKEKIEFAFNSDSEDIKPLNVMFPLFRYHSRWSKLKKVDFQYVTNTLEETYLRGHCVSYSQVPAEFKFEQESEFEIHEKNLHFYQRIIDLCREKGVELITYKIPTPLWDKTHSAAAEKAAAERGEEYWDLYYEFDEIGLDKNLDYKDATDHLNQYGAEKLTLYIGNYLMENYDLEDQRGKNKDWDEDIEGYHNYKEITKKEFE